MEKKYLIYKHTNKINGKSYIGQTCQDPERRWRKGEGYKDSPKFYSAIKKYGWDNFTHEIIEDNLTFEEANEKEVYWIKYYDTYNNDNKGYNMTLGGNNYMSELWKDSEYKQRMKESFSKARKRDWNEEKLEKMLKGLEKAWNDEEWRKERINNLIGDKNPNSKKVVNIETNKQFSTIKEAAEWAGLKSVSGIGECCKGRRKTSGKHPETGVPLHWKYLNEEAPIVVDKRNRIKVICLNNNKIFNSMSEASRWCGLKDNGKSIKACCIGAQKTAGSSPLTGERLKWSFVEGGDFYEGK